MNLEWMTIDYYIKHYRDEKSKYSGSLWEINEVCDNLFNKFPTPKEWLEASIEEKINGIYDSHSFSQYQYILAFIWDRKLYEDTSLTHALAEYLMHPMNNGKKAHSYFIREIGLMTDKEFNLLSSECRKPMCVVCLLHGKAFKDLTDDEVVSLPEVFQGRCRPKKIQDVRFKLGYTNQIMKSKGKGSKWTKLESLPNLGDIFKEYHQYLIACDATYKYLTNTVGALCYLYDYIQKSGHEDFSHFKHDDYVELTEKIRKEKSDVSAMSYVATYKKFFGWGAIELNEFPKDLDFPNMYWSEISRANKKARRETDGRAFTQENLANDIMKTVVSYVPKNDTEEVCRALWIVVGCSPSRLQFILDLEADSSLKPLPNEPDTLAVYSRFADKAGNQYGQFPILDKLGVDAIKSLQKRAIEKNLPPIRNDETNDTYVHLFQLTEKPWRPLKYIFYNFYKANISPKIKEIYPNIELDENYEVNAHGFRHHLLTHTGFESGNIEVVQTAAGHRDAKMTKEYLRSKVSKKALLYKVLDKYEKHEISGKFYLRLVELLTTENTDIDDIFTALSSEMTMDQFIVTYGKKMDIGYCFNSAHCSNWLKCWSCTNFMMTKEEINHAIITLSRLITNIKKAQKTCVDFSFEHPMINTQIKTISLITKRLNELGISEEQIVTMFNNLIHNKDISEGVISDAS